MLEWLNQYFFGVLVPVILLAVGAFYWAKLRFFLPRRIGAIVRALHSERKERRGQGASSFRALMLALAGTLGVGNIVGVSAAIALGGFGSVFWLWVSATFAMILKYAEVVLGMRHRRYGEDGKPYGGAPYYIRDIFRAGGFPRLGVVLGGMFALLCALNAVAMGGMIQANAVAEAVEGMAGISPIIVGGALSVLGFFVMRKGSEGAARVTEVLVPLMTVVYVVLSMAVLILRADAIPSAFAEIFEGAFTPEAGVGGVGGFLLSRGVRFGTMRGLISNEAGCGTAPTAHATSEERSAAKQGMLGIVEVFVDTHILCTMTALVVIVSWGEIVASKGSAGNFLSMTLSAYSTVLGKPAEIFMGIAVALFGFATILCWGHYGKESIRYLSAKRWAEKSFLICYLAAVMIGACAAAELVWGLADFAIGAMTLVNALVLILASKEVGEETDAWLTPHRKSFRPPFSKGGTSPAPCGAGRPSQRAKSPILPKRPKG